MQALSPPPTVIVLVHRGRESGRLYRTPLSMLAEDPGREEVFVSPMWGRDCDWYRAFREAHPIYSRMIVGRLARLNRLEGDPAEAVMRNLPMLGLRRVES